MGALSSVLTGVGSAYTALNTIESTLGKLSNLASGGASESSRLRAEQDLAMRQLQERQAADENYDAQQAALDKTKIAADAQAAETSRRAALRRAVARQRAAFGAQGLDSASGDGSSQAVLLGLFDESDEERAQREQSDTLRSQAIDNDLVQQSRINVLQRQQLKERQKLEREIYG